MRTPGQRRTTTRQAAGRAPCLSAGFAVAFGALTMAAHAGDIDTEFLFGFLTGTDIGDVGDREFENETTGRLARRSGSYSAFTQTNSVELVPIENLRVEPGVALARHDIAAVSGLDDVRRSSLQGAFLDLRYRLLDRAQSRLGFSVQVAPQWGRVDETSGQPVDQYGCDFGLLFDYEPIPDRIVTAFNLLYEPQATRAAGNGQWSRDATLGLGGAVMALVRPGVLIGGEVRYLRAYDSIGLGDFAGQALFVGPTVFVKPAANWRLTAAWSVQVAGQAPGAPSPLDLTHFTRQEVRLRVGYEF